MVFFQNEQWELREFCSLPFPRRYLLSHILWFTAPTLPQYIIPILKYHILWGVKFWLEYLKILKCLNCPYQRAWPFLRDPENPRGEKQRNLGWSTLKQFYSPQKDQNHLIMQISGPQSNSIYRKEIKPPSLLRLKGKAKKLPRPLCLCIHSNSNLLFFRLIWILCSI